MAKVKRPTESRKERTHNINLHAMEVFCEVLRQASFSRGGEVVGISQSAASQLIAHLEEELGFKLIDRKRRPPSPTAEGEIYFRGCLELLHSHRDLISEVKRGHEDVVGPVRVASIYSVGLHTLTSYIQTFMAQFRESTVQLEYLHPMKVYAAVLEEDADLGVISYPKPNRNLITTPWLEEAMVLACPQGHRLATQESIDIKELRGEKFVAFDGDLSIRREIERVFRNNQVHVEIVSQFDNIETIKQALEISQALSILPRPSIQREVERGMLVEIRLKGVELVRPVAIIQKRRRKMTRASEEFLATLLDKTAKA